MSAIAFDTLKFANKLKDAGVPDKQAEAQASIMAEALQVNLDSLATKEQVERLRVDMRRDNEQQRSDTNKEFQIVRQEMAQMKTELLQVIAHNETRSDGQIQMLRWMITAMLAMLTGMFIRLIFFGLK